MKRFIFVYGTLMQRQPAHYLLVGVSTYVGEATTVGTLYSMGPYPAFQPKGEDTVHGELYIVDDETGNGKGAVMKLVSDNNSVYLSSNNQPSP